MSFAAVLGSLLGLLVTPMVVLAIIQIYLYKSSPLNTIPGPYLAQFTNVWRLCDHLKRRPERTQQALHAKYGPVVRIGPNMVSLSDPELVRLVYDSRGQFFKVSLRTCRPYPPGTGLGDHDQS